MNNVVFWICYIVFHFTNEIYSKIRNMVTLMTDTAFLCPPLEYGTLTALWRQNFEVVLRVRGLYVICID